MAEKLQITKRSNIKGDDGHRTFSVRIREDIANQLDELALQTNRSRNELINLILEFGINNCEINED